jgi:hypothetical protein
MQVIQGKSPKLRVYIFTRGLTHKNVASALDFIFKWVETSLARLDKPWDKIERLFIEVYGAVRNNAKRSL